MNMTREQFLEKYGGKATHCKTEKLAIEFVELAEIFELGFHPSISRFGSKTRYNSYREDTTYFVDKDNSMSFSDLKYTKENHYEIVKFIGENNQLNNQSKKEKTMDNKNFANEGKVMKITVARMMRKMGIEKVVFSKGTTIVYLNNGTEDNEYNYISESGSKGVSYTSGNDEFDPVVGLSVAYAMAVATNGNKHCFKDNVDKMNERFRTQPLEEEVEIVAVEEVAKTETVEETTEEKE